SVARVLRSAKTSSKNPSQKNFDLTFYYCGSVIAGQPVTRRPQLRAQQSRAPGNVPARVLEKRSAEVCPMRFVRENRWSRISVVLTCVAIAIVLTTLAPHQEAFADDNELAAVYHRGSLEVIVPHDETVARNKVLVLEIVDPNDKLVAKAVRYASPDIRASKVTMPLDDSLNIEDIAWDRLKVRVGDSSKIVSLSEILRVPVVRVFAQRAYAAGSPASVRIITVDSRSGNPLRDTRVKLELMNGDSAITLFTGRTDGFGTAQVAFTLPVDSFGSRQLRVSADTTLGTVTANQPIQLERRDRILLTTDKPLYQPGQTIHLRALALDGPTHARLPNSRSPWRSKTERATRSSRNEVAPTSLALPPLISSWPMKSTSAPITSAPSSAIPTPRPH